MKLDILVLNDYAFLNGGSSAVALASARGLAEAGHSVALLTAVGPVDKGLGPPLEVLCLGQKEIAADPNRLRAFFGGILNQKAVHAVDRLLDSRDPRSTIVHVHTWTKSLSAFAIHAAIRRGFKVVVTLHDFFIVCPTGALFLPKTAELCEKKPLSWDCVSCSCDRRHYSHKLWRSARTWIQNKVLHVPEGVAHFVAVSDLAARLTRQWLPVHNGITVVRNPVECRDAGPASVAENAPFLFVGRFTLEKGVLLAAEALGKMKAPAVFIGDGELMDDARKLCPHGTFTGWLSPDQVAQWRRKARALLFPPLWYETLGLVVIEAAADGVPSVVSDRCAAADFVTHGERGLHFEHGSVDSLCEQIAALMDGETAARIGRNAYKWYWDAPWDLGSHVNELVALYENVLTGEPASRSCSAVEALAR